jgi:hypothetical protein
MSDDQRHGADGAIRFRAQFIGKTDREASSI